MGILSLTSEPKPRPFDLLISNLTAAPKPDPSPRLHHVTHTTLRHTTSQYHQACADLETARLKHTRAPRDDKHLPRLLKSYRTALVAKNNARNNYVIALGVGNREKEVFYDRTERKGLGEGAGGGGEGTADTLVTPFGPGIARPQAELQTLFHTSTLRLNSLLSHSSTVYSHFYTAQATYAQSIVEAHRKVDPAKDADLYAEWNLRPKLEEAPVLKVFEPCPGFLEEGVITLGGGDQLGFDEPGGKAGLGPAPTNSNSTTNPNGSHKGEEVVVLQNKLAVARETRTTLNGLCVGWRGEIRRGRGVVQAYEENRGLGDPDEIVEVSPRRDWLCGRETMLIFLPSEPISDVVCAVFPDDFDLGGDG